MERTQNRDAARPDLETEASTDAARRSNSQSFLIEFVKALARDSARQYNELEQTKNILPCSNSGNDQ